MDRPGDKKQPDVLLLPFLQPGNEAELEGSLSRLISEQTESTIKGIIRSKLRVSLSLTDGSNSNQEALELISEVQTVLIAELRALRTDRNGRVISNFHSYVAAVTFNACNQVLRRKYPRRWRLKNKLRYLLTHAPEFALWEADNREWLSGFAAWHGKRQTPGSISQLPGPQDTRPWLSSWFEGTNERQALVELLTSVFRESDGPVVLDDLVTLVANLRGIREEVADAKSTGQADEWQDRLSEPAVSVLTKMEQRDRLQKLWTEICLLPLRHRSALLLNLRDSHGADTLALLPLARIATVRQIGVLLAFSPEHFASVWNELPWDDATIAKHLDLTRQQIINLRQSARARLARKMMWSRRCR